MGITYKAYDADLERAVALKVINENFLGDENARRRFLREARAAASVRHTHVASVFYLGKTGENYFYAMEFVEGETLSRLIDRQGPLDPALALNITAQVAEGLQAVHQSKLVHRDIKPSNIMLQPGEKGAVTAKIIDLGLAKSVVEDGGEKSISAAGGFVGTPEYASPEQFVGLPTDIRSDIYSLGVTLWKILVGRVPFQGSAAELMFKSQDARLPLEQLANVPGPIRMLLEIMLQRDPARRFQTPAEAQHAMQKVTTAIRKGGSLTSEDLKSPTDEISNLTLPGSKSAVAPRRWAPIHPLTFLGALAIGCAVTYFFLGTPSGRRLITGTDALGSIPEKSVAVLPFESLSPDQSDAYFATGVQDEIISDLSHVADLRVISRTSVLSYAPTKGRDLHAIAQALGVANIIEGTVRRSSNRVRVITSLVNATTGDTVWSETYDRDLTDIFQIQTDIAQSVAAKLRSNISPQERAGIEQRATTSLEAYDLYLQAKQIMTQAELFIGNDTNSFLEAIKLLEQATALDSEFALAYCLQARADDDLYFSLLDHTPARRLAGDAAIGKALSARPDLPEVHLAVAYHLYEAYRSYDRALVHIAIAERDLPNDPNALATRAYIARRQGRWEESIKALEKARIVDPRNPDVLNNLAYNLQRIRRYQESENVYNRLISLEPTNPVFNAQKVYRSFAERGELEEYRKVLAAMPSPWRNDLGFQSERFYFAALARDWNAAAQILQEDNGKQFSFFNETIVMPKTCVEVWLAKVKGDLLDSKSRLAGVFAELTQQMEKEPDNVSLLSVLALMHAAFGQKQAIDEAERAAELMPIAHDSLFGPGVLFNLAVVHAWLGDRDGALSALETLARTPGALNYGELKWDPALDTLRSEPSFKSILDRFAP